MQHDNDTIKKLENDLWARLIQWETNSFNTLTREATHAKAHEVTAGWALLKAVGEERFTAWVNHFYDNDIFYMSKPDTELPIPGKKRAWEVADDDPERETKRGRTDPDCIQDMELVTGMVHCDACGTRLKAKDACYSRSNRPDTIVCLRCWQENERQRICAHCHSEINERPLPLDAPYVCGGLRPVSYDGIHTHAGFMCRPCAECLRVSETTNVVHLKRSTKQGHVIQDCDVYIGRACNQGGWQLKDSVWANPFKLPAGRKSTKEEIQEVLDKYEMYVRGRPDLMARLPELYGKRLGCWCKPKACHGDVLVKLIKESLPWSFL